MEYKVVKQLEGYVTLGDLKKDIEEFGTSRVRNNCLIKKNNQTYKIVFGWNVYHLLNVDKLYLEIRVSFGCTFEQVIEKLLADGYEVIYEK